MTTIKTQLLRSLATRSSRAETGSNRGFTLVELLVVVAIVGILSAVALPQFLGQTKKAAATEGTQTASSIAKQAVAYYLEQGKLGTIDTTCETYAGKIKKDNLNFEYKCSGDAEAFVVTATGSADDANTKDVEVKFTANLTDGTFSKPVVNLDTSS